MPRKKAVDPEHTDMTPEDIGSETEIEACESGPDEATEASDLLIPVADTETEIEFDENKMPGLNESAFEEENAPVPETEMGNDTEEGEGRPEGTADMTGKPVLETDTAHIDYPSETDIQDENAGALLSKEDTNTPVSETDIEKPKRKRGRPKKQDAESESPEPAMKTRVRAAARKAGSQILSIDDELTVELDTDKSRNDLLDLSESMNGTRILSGVIQGIERLDSGMSFAVIYYNSYKIVIPTEEIISLPRNLGDRDPQAVMHAQLNRRLGAEIEFVIKGIDQKAGLAAASRTEAMNRKRKRYFYGTDRDGNNRIYEGLCAEARVMSTIRNGIFVEFFGVETYIPLMELSYQRWHDATEHFQNGERILVKVLSLDKSDPENIQLELSKKRTGENPFDSAISRYKRGNRYIGKTSMIIPSGVIVALDGEIDCLCRFPARGRPPVGSRVTVLINGVNHEAKRVWGVILHVSPR